MKTRINSITIFFAALLVGSTFTSCTSDPADSPVERKVEFQAEFPGGYDSLVAFMQENFHYPEEAVEQNIGGEVLVNFVVEADGKITHVGVQESVHPVLDFEAERIVRAMPRWNPTIENGKKIRTNCQLPINFTLD